VSAARFWFGAELRARWRATLGLALLVGVVAGACLAAAAGARRTQSAYPRFFARYGVFDVDVSTGGDPGTDRIFDEIAHLPQVVATSRQSLFVGSLTARSQTVSFPDVLMIAAHEAEGFDADGVKVVRGRLPEPEAVEEAVAGYAFAERLGLSPGDTMTVSMAPAAGQSDVSGTDARETQKLRLVGVVAAVGSFETLTGRGFPNVVALTPAFFRAHRPAALTDSDTLSVALRHGEADLPGFADEILRRGIPLTAPPQPASVYTTDVQAVNRVPVVTLWAATGVLALAAVAIFGQALTREMLARADDFPTLRTLGMSRATLTAVSVAKGVLVGAAGAAVAVGVAVLASPLMPLGLARIAEPDPGFATDWLVLGIGAAATFLVISAVSVLPARRAARRAEVTRPGGGDARPAAIVGVVASAGLPTSMTSGVRLATRASGPAEPMPVRTAFVGTAFSIAALTAALVFASSLGHLVHEPRLFGYSWDAAVIANSENLDDLTKSLPRDLVAESWKGRVFASVHVDSLLLEALASEGPPPSIITGRAPAAPDEVALDPRTLDRLDKGLDDTVSVAGPPGEGDEASAAAPHRMRIVGSFAVPRFPFQSDENPGQAAAFTPAGLSSIPGNADLDAVFVMFRAGVDPIDGVQRLKEATAEGAFAVISAQRIGAVRGVQRISAAPWFLAVVLAVLAIGTLTHTLVLTTRRRRRDLAILKTLGFVGRQVRATVAWLAVAIVAPALLLGLPIGIAAGRWGWRRFADYLAVVPEPVAPAAGALLIAVAVIAVANVIAAGAAEIATRIRPAAVFKSE
jgi:putative ABC transport system permease protein